MKYDIAAKVIVDMGKEVILRRFLKMDPGSIQLLEELPEETVSLRRSDFPLHVVLKDGKEIIVLVEIQTHFNRDFVLRMIDYTVRFELKYHLEVIPLVLLLTPSLLATGFYEDNIHTFKYQIVRLWEERAENYMDEIYLYPFIPLMEQGEDLLDRAETRIYDNVEMNMEKKGDLLTAMAIFAGLKDKGLAVNLIKRRRDIMRQSAAYEVIKEEGLKEGIQQGMQQGIRQSLLDMLEIKFETVPLRLVKAINDITDAEILRMLHRHAMKCSSTEEFEEKMRLIIEG
jgi:predicted transposase YdaD